MKNVLELLHLAKEKQASDLHFMVDSPPILRINGHLEAIDGMDILSSADVVNAFNQLTTEAQRAAFHNNMELDFSYNISGIGRFRCNASLQRQSISLALRLLPPTVPTIDELELPPICKQLALMPRGLIVISGPTGSSKTTTLAAMINHINMHKTCHVVTIEDPLEYNHVNNNSIITQRELGTDTQSFSKALKYVLR